VRAIVPPGKEAETGDAKGADWESILDASAGADDIPSKKGKNADANIRMMPFVPSHISTVRSDDGGME
jgi:hypothetical protein